MFYIRLTQKWIIHEISGKSRRCFCNAGVLQRLSLIPHILTEERTCLRPLCFKILYIIICVIIKGWGRQQNLSRNSEQRSEVVNNKIKILFFFFKNGIYLKKEQERGGKSQCYLCRFCTVRYKITQHLIKALKSTWNYIYNPFNLLILRKCILDFIQEESDSGEKIFTSV